MGGVRPLRGTSTSSPWLLTEGMTSRNSNSRHPHLLKNTMLYSRPSRSVPHLNACSRCFRPLWSTLLALIVTVLSSTASAQVVGPMYEVDVRGVPMSCTSYRGEAVAIYLDRRLQNVGVASHDVAGEPIIVINPDVTRRFSSLVTQWWFAHECAHHALPASENTEPNADCFGVRELRRVGLLYDPRQLRAFAVELAGLPGSPSGHLPGPLRARQIAECAMY